MAESSSVVDSKISTVRAAVANHFNESESRGKRFEDRLTEYVDIQKENAEVGEKAKSDLAASKKSLAAKERELKNLNNLALISGAYSSIMEAELMFQSGKSKEAASKLESIKGPVWKASGIYPESKDKLRGLMGPIDGLIGQWKRNDKKGSSVSIRETLQSILKKYTT